MKGQGNSTMWSKRTVQILKKTFGCHLALKMLTLKLSKAPKELLGIEIDDWFQALLVSKPTQTHRLSLHVTSRWTNTSKLSQNSNSKWDLKPGLLD